MLAYRLYSRERFIKTDKQSFSTGVGLKNRGGKGEGRASLRLMWRVCGRAGLQGAPEALTVTGSVYLGTCKENGCFYG